MYDIIIVGGGASGSMCAITASQRGKKVLLIDKDYYPAKKLMVTGNGRCNLTNINSNSKNFNQNIDKFLKRFNSKKTIEYFESIGLVVDVDDEGRVYPFSHTAKSVISVLNKQLKDVDIINNEKVNKISKLQNAYEIMTENNRFIGRKVIIANGRLDEKVLEEFEVEKTLLSPSLCALMTSSTKKLSGIRLENVKVTAKCKNMIMKDKGEVLFKDSGLSGIVIFNLSCLFARNHCFEGSVSINLMPEFSFNEVENLIKSRLNKADTLEDLFKGWFHDEIANEIIARCGMERKMKCNVLTNKNIESLASTISDFVFKIVGHYDNNQVVSGGIDLNSLTENLESKKYKGLYFIGEVCDVDGECGGHNLQWAWTSGKIVGEQA